MGLVFRGGGVGYQWEHLVHIRHLNLSLAKHVHRGGGGGCGACALE